MAQITIEEKFNINGVLTDVTSAILKDPTNTFGVKRNDTGAIVVATGTPLVKVATGIYRYTFTEPAMNLAYTRWVTWVYSGETYCDEYVFDGAKLDSTISHFTTIDIFETKIKKLAADNRLELSANEKQSITIFGTPTGGNFKLSFRGEITGNIAYNASISDIITALQTLSTIGIGNCSGSGGPMPGISVEIIFIDQLAETDVPLMFIDTTNLTGGSNTSGIIEEKIKGYGDNIIARRRLDQAYNAIEAILIGRSLTRLQLSIWARGEEFQLDIATYWYCKDSGWGGKLVDEKDWTKVFDRISELEKMTIIDNNGNILLQGKGPVAKVIDLISANTNLGINF